MESLYLKEFFVNFARLIDFFLIHIFKQAQNQKSFFQNFSLFSYLVNV